MSNIKTKRVTGKLISLAAITKNSRSREIVDFAVTIEITRAKLFKFKETYYTDNNRVAMLVSGFLEGNEGQTVYLDVRDDILYVCGVLR